MKKNGDLSKNPTLFCAFYLVESMILLILLLTFCDKSDMITSMNRRFNARIFYKMF